MYVCVLEIAIQQYYGVWGAYNLLHGSAPYKYHLNDINWYSFEWADLAQIYMSKCKIVKARDSLKSAIPL